MPTCAALRFRWRAFASAVETDSFVEISTHRERAMQMTLAIGPLVALIAGILILVVPRLLNFIVAIYLIIIGLLGLFGGHLNLH